MQKYEGDIIFEGIVIGKPYLLTRENHKIINYKIKEEDIFKERIKLKEAIKNTKKDIQLLIDSLRDKITSEEIKILNVQLMMLDDPVFISEINNKIHSEYFTAMKSIDVVVKRYSEMFANIQEESFRQRGLDVKDVGLKLLKNINSEKTKFNNLNNKILVTRELYPSELLKIHSDKINLLGIITEEGGKTSHVAILAKTLEIPMLTGIKNIKNIPWKNTIILDNRKGKGEIIFTQELKILESYYYEKRKYHKIQYDLDKKSKEPAFTVDGKKIEVHYNISGDIDFKDLENKNSNGIGLLRTEFIYMEGQNFPNEEEQIAIYEDIYNRLGNDKPMTIRTLDIGADKSLPYFDLPKESNPFLGLRGIRFTLAYEDIFKAQLKAILRVANCRNIKIMFPMITNIIELDKTLAIMELAKEELHNKNIKFNQNIEIGIMVEVPSTIFLADSFAKKIDFFSIGTNDLTQYILAVDRLNEDLAYLYESYSPAIYRALNSLTTISNKYGKEVSICGEMAGEPMGIVFFLSLGITNLSMIPSFVPKAKAIIRSLNAKNIENIKNKLLSANTSKEVKKILSLCINEENYENNTSIYKQ